MFTKEFIRISQILDHHGMHRQADDLLKIAQAVPPPVLAIPPPVLANPAPELAALSRLTPGSLQPTAPQPMTPPQPKGNTTKPATKSTTKPATKSPNQPSKPAAPTARPVTLMTPAEQNKRFEHYAREISSINDKVKAENLKTQIDLQYKNNYLDYATYKRLIDSLKMKAEPFGLNITPVNPMDPTAFPTDINATPMSGRGTYLNSDGVATPIGIQLATPLEGLTAAGEKALPNREERDLPALVENWNEYLKTNSFKENIQARINELKGQNKDTTQLQQLLDKAKSDEGLKVGDFGNNGKASEVYGVEAKPATSITGTPTTPAPGTTTPVAPSGTTVPNR